MPAQNILLNIENPVLRRVIEEQLSVFKSVKIDPSMPPDVMIAQQGFSSVEGLSATTGILEIPKGAIRIGDIMDRLHYMMSGRENHIEEDGENIDLGDFILTPSQNSMTYKQSGQMVKLTDKERLVLRYLFEAGESGLSRKDLLKSVWGYADEAETHTLETHIYRLRQKIEAVTHHHLIKILDGVYKIDIKKPA